MIDRRKFLAAASLVAGSARGSSGRTTPLKANFWGTQYYDEKEQQQLTDVLSARQPFRWYGPGSTPPMKVASFEREFAARMQTRYALAVSSGTAALQCAMAALGIGPGDEVILPAWTWHSCYSAIVLAGALPVFAEIDESFNIDPSDIEHRITPHTKVILAAHLQGNPCDMDRILPIARKHGIRVLEDCAQSVGASHKARPVGSIGDIGIYSLQLNKTITAGEGGAVVTNDAELFEGASRFHDLGSLRALHENVAGGHRLNAFAGTNFRMSEFAGGVLLAQLRKLDMIVRDVRANAQRVYDGIRDLPNLKLRYRPDPEGELGAGIYLGFRGKEQRERFRAAMNDAYIAVAPPTGSVLLPVQEYIEHKRTVHPGWPSFTSERGRAIQYGAGCCPRTIDILDRYAGVLMDPKFSVRDTEDIVAAIRKVYPTVA
jgi:8-amino-3,8-dideoxy-alpha-D-manno-octulosonate transaminase